MEEYKGNNIQGWMREKELQWLYKTASGMRSIVEIGSWKGRGTHALLSGCKGFVFAIDHFHGSPDKLNTLHKEATEGNIYKEFYDNVGSFPNLIVMRTESVIASRFFKSKSIDMVFIDGCHLKQSVLIDVLAWLPICRKLLCGHDKGEDGIDEALQILNLSVETEVGSIWSLNIRD